MDRAELSAVDPGVHNVITVVFLGGGRRRKNGLPHFEEYHITAKEWRQDTFQAHLAKWYAAAVRRNTAAGAAISAMSASSLRTVNLDQLLAAIKVHLRHRRALVRVTGSRRLARLQFRVASRVRSKLFLLCHWLLGAPGSDRRVAFGAADFKNHARGPVLMIRDFLKKERPDQVALVDEFRTSKASAVSVFRGHSLDLEQMVGDVKQRDGTITRGQVWAVKQSKKEDYTVNRDLNAAMNIWRTAVMQSETGTNDRPVGLREEDN